MVSEQFPTPPTEYPKKNSSPKIFLSGKPKSRENERETTFLQWGKTFKVPPGSKKVWTTFFFFIAKPSDLGKVLSQTCRTRDKDRYVLSKDLAAKRKNYFSNLLQTQNLKSNQVSTYFRMVSEQFPTPPTEYPKKNSSPKIFLSGKPKSRENERETTFLQWGKTFKVPPGSKKVWTTFFFFIAKPSDLGKVLSQTCRTRDKDRYVLSKDLAAKRKNYFSNLLQTQNLKSNQVSTYFRMVSEQFPPYPNAYFCANSVIKWFSLSQPTHFEHFWGYRDNSDPGVHTISTK